MPADVSETHGSGPLPRAEVRKLDENQNTWPDWQTVGLGSDRELSLGQSPVWKPTLGFRQPALAGLAVVPQLSL